MNSFILEFNKHIDDNNKNNPKVSISNLNISSFPKVSSSQNMINNKNYIPDTENNKINQSYLCKYCYSFPLITIIDDNTIMIQCLDEVNGQKTFDIMFNYRIYPVTDEIQKMEKCHQNENNTNNSNYNIFEYYCKKCKKNLCKECYELCFSDPEHTDKDIIKFAELDKKMKYKEEYYDNYFQKYIEKEIKRIRGNKKYETELKEKEINVNIVDNENNIQIQKKEKETKIILDRHKFMANLKKLIKIIFYNKKNYPNFNHYLNLKNIYYYLCDKLDIEYFNYLNQSERDINIFGKKFVENNRKNCCLMINNKKVKLREDYHIEEDKKLEITLVKKKPITNMSEMFKDCDSLFNIKVNKHWAMDDVTEMHSMFYKCISLKDINEFFSDCNTSKVSDFSNMFFECECLRNIKYISNFNTSNATNLSNMFYGCLNLLECDLTEWKTDNVSYMSYMFSGCENLEKLIGIDKWNTENVIYMNNTFENCENLKEFSDISKWKIRKDIDMNKIFNGFSTLVEKPNWKKENI